MKQYHETSVICPYCSHEPDSEEMSDNGLYEYEDQSDNEIKCSMCGEVFFVNRIMCFDFESSNTNEYGETYNEQQGRDFIESEEDVYECSKCKKPTKHEIGRHKRKDGNIGIIAECKECKNEKIWIVTKD